jgi:Family of unknown function (DUF6069)
MTYPASPESGETRVRPDAGQFWAGVAATAIVAALVALVGILICRWTLGIPILAPSSDGAWGNAHTGEYVLAAVGVALVAGALLYLLALSTPQPGMFLGWIIGLATLAAVVYPFSTGAALEQKAATAIVNLVLGIAIGTLLNTVAARAARRYRSVRPPAGQPGERDRYPRDPHDRDRYDHPPTQPMDYPPSRTPGDY